MASKVPKKFLAMVVLLIGSGLVFTGAASIVGVVLIIGAISYLLGLI